jgi:hypothetical protein
MVTGMAEQYDQSPQPLKSGGAIPGKSPTDLLSAPENQKTRSRITVLITAFIPLVMFILPKSVSPLCRDPMPLIYTAFGVGYFFQPELTRLARKMPLPVWLKFIVFSIVAGWCGELFAWYGNYLEKNPEPALLHPQLIPDLIFAIGFYGGWACAWAVAFSLFRWSIPLIFITIGTFGWVVEQKAALLIGFFQNISTHPFTGAYWLFYILIVYGSILCLGLVPVQVDLKPRFPQAPAWVHLMKIPFLWALSWLGAHVVLGLLMFVTDRLGIIPPPKSIVEHPFF